MTWKYDSGAEFVRLPSETSLNLATRGFWTDRIYGKRSEPASVKFAN